jgi:hypothetical protein
MANQTERIELRANDAFVRELDSLGGGKLSRADVIRRAVALYSHVVEQETNGRQLGFVVKNSEGSDVVEETIMVSGS